MKNDPLEILIVPHEVIVWQNKRGFLMKRFFPESIKLETLKGKWAIFHRKLMLSNKFLSDTEEEAKKKIEEIIGSKRKCIENKRIYSVKQF